MPLTTKGKMNYLVSQPNYHRTNFFSKNLLKIGMKRTRILMNKPVHLGLPILQISKTVIYWFWCNYMKPKYGKKKQNYITWIEIAL